MCADPPTLDALEEWTLAGLHKELADSLPSLGRDAAILDLGCGTGAWLARLMRLGFVDLSGVDKRLATTLPAGITYVQCNLDEGEWPLPGRKFALITAIELVEHLENPGAFFQNVGCHLRSDGYLLLTTPNIQSVHARLHFLARASLPHFDDKGEPTHVSPMLLECLNRMLPRHGLRIERTWGYPRRGSLTSRFLTRVGSLILSPFVKEGVPGDILCILAKATAGTADAVGPLALRPSHGPGL